MNTDYRVELFQEDIMQTIGVLFDRPADPHNIGRSAGRVYTYKADKEMELKVGDQVVVEVSNEMKVVTVVEVHEFPQIDYTQSSTFYKWVVSKIDLNRYNQLLEHDKVIRHNLRLLAHSNQRNSLLAQLKAEYGEDVVASMSRPALNVPNFRKGNIIGTPPDEA